MTVFSELTGLGGRRYAVRYPTVFGQQFGRRTVMGDGPRVRGQRQWRMLCACGGEDDVPVASVIRTRATQCDWCARRRQTGAASRAWRGHGSVPSTAYTHFRFTAQSRGIEWRLTIQDIDALYTAQGGRCALTDTPLTFRPGNRKPGNASLDRKDSAGIYEAGNVWLVTTAVNIGKQSMSVEEFVAMCRAVARKADAE